MNFRNDEVHEGGYEERCKNEYENEYENGYKNLYV